MLMLAHDMFGFYSNAHVLLHPSTEGIHAMPRLIIELKLASQPDHPVKITYDSRTPSHPLWLVGVNGGPLAFDLWRVGIEHVAVTGIDTKADFVNALIAEYPLAGTLPEQKLSHLLAQRTFVKIEPTEGHVVPGTFSVHLPDGEVLFTDRIMDETVLMH